MKLKKTLAAALAANAMFAASPASAVTYFFTDFDSYDVDSQTPDTGGVGWDLVSSIEGWSVSSGPAIEVQAGIAGEAFSPENLVELDSTSNSGMSREIEAGNYLLTFYYSPRPGIGPESNGINVLVNNNLVFGTTGQGQPLITTWTQMFVPILVTGTSTLTFQATGTSNSLGGYVDSIGLNAVPEPATWAMMITGFGFVGAALRRRRKLGALQTA